MTEAWRILVQGRVQGVGYRAWTVRRARALGLAGWVRNRSDGAVEILAAGPPEALAALVAACRTGPPAAAVASVDHAPAPPPKREGFDQAATVQAGK